MTSLQMAEDTKAGKDQRIDWFRAMLRIRLVEEAIAARYPEQEIRCPTHLSIGQEAAAVGVCSALAYTDHVFSTHRAHAHYLAKGGNLRAMIAELYGRATGCCGGWGGSMHVTDIDCGFVAATPIVGGSIPLAVGDAFSAVMRGIDRVTVVFIGDGATEEGVLHETLNFAALQSLPVIFVCENNGYSVYSPLSVRQSTNRDRVAMARAQGLSADCGFGNDVGSVYELARKAVERARSGGGPTYLELDTYRLREHCGPSFDDDLGYRPALEVAWWKQHCPVDQLRQKLLAEETVTLSELQGFSTEIIREIEGAFAYARSSPFPDRSELERDPFSTPLLFDAEAAR